MVFEIPVYQFINKDLYLFSISTTWAVEDKAKKNKKVFSYPLFQKEVLRQ